MDGTNALPEDFSRNGDTIRYHDIEFKGVRADSFQVLDGSFCKDDRRVFYYNSYRDPSAYFLAKKHEVQRLEGADAPTFTVLGYNYARDQGKAWYKAEPFTVADVSSLQPIDARFAKDKVQAYLDRTPIRGSHGPSFTLIDISYARDTNHYYFINGSGNDERIAPIPCDLASFRLVDLSYATDKDHVFHQGVIIKGAEPASFVVLGSSYAKDEHSVYFREERVAGADPASFTLFTENENSNGVTYYAKDKDRIYVNADVFPDVDRASFRILDEKYTLDKNGVYHRMKRVPQADPLTFKVYPHFMGDADAEDKAHKYGEGQIVE